jgi:hypothetical protein
MKGREKRGKKMREEMVDQTANQAAKLLKKDERRKNITSSGIVELQS